MCHNTECSAHRQPPPSRDPLLPLLIYGLNAFLAGVVGLILISGVTFWVIRLNLS